MKFILKLFYLLILLILPFILLIRLAVWMHTTYAWNGWMALGVSCAATTILMLLYFTVMYSKMTGKLGTWLALKRRAYFAGFLVFSFAAYSLFYISSDNVKYADVRSAYRELHPILRMSIATVILVDRNLLITDAGRLPEDYKKMGLKSKKNSLHYLQADGFTHALDLRTNNRAEWSNKMVELYFRMMGFNTLRHVGTDDHLHVSLMVHERPWAK